MLTITEVTRTHAVSTRMLRYYEQQGLLRSQRREGYAYRVYDEKNIARLRLKESDRVASTIAMIESLGGKAEADENTLTVHGTGLRGGTVDAQNDHRIAMSAAIAATVCTGAVTILGAQCVEKSYPGFWAEYFRLQSNP